PRAHPGHPAARPEAPAPPELLQPPNAPPLSDVEHSKKYKTREQVFPVDEAQGKKDRILRKVHVRGQVRQSDGNERQQKCQMLACHFVDDHLLGILARRISSYARGAPHAKNRKQKEKYPGKEERNGQRRTVDVQ